MPRQRNGTTVIWIDITKDERALLKQLADLEGVTVPSFVRGCINDRLAEDDTNPALLKMRTIGRPRKELQ